MNGSQPEGGDCEREASRRASDWRASSARLNFGSNFEPGVVLNLGLTWISWLEPSFRLRDQILLRETMERTGGKIVAVVVIVTSRSSGRTIVALLLLLLLFLRLLL